MALEKRVAVLAMTGGIEAGTDLKVSPGLTRVENAAFEVEGALRPVRAQQVVGSAQTGAHTLMTGPNGPLRYYEDGTTGAIQSPIGASQDTWTDLKSSPGLLATTYKRQNLARGDLYYAYEVAASTNYYAIAYTTRDDAASTVYRGVVETYDKTTGQLVDEAELFSGSSYDQIRIVTADTSIRIFYAVSDVIYARIIDANGLIGSGVSSTYTRAAGSAFDACVVVDASGSTDYVAVAIKTSATAARMFSYSAASTTVATSWTETSYTAVNALWLCYAGSSKIRLIVSDNGALWIREFGYGGAATGASTTHTPAGTVTGAISYGSYLYYSEYVSVSSVATMRLYSCSYVPATPTLGTKTPMMAHVAIATKAWATATGHAFAVDVRVPGEISATTYEQTNYLVIQASWDSTSVGAPVISKARTGSQYAATSPVRNVGTISGVTWDIAAEVVQISDGDSQRGTHRALLMQHATGPTNFDHALLGELANVAGAQPLHIDGVQSVEMGFHSWPVVLAATGSASGGSILAGTYRYRAVFEWIDAKGRIHRSAATTTPKEVTLTGSTSSVTVVVSTCAPTRRRNVLVVLYRTLANGTVYYRVAATTQSDPSSQSAGSAPPVSVSFTDTLGDSSIEDNATLYTSGGVLEAVDPFPMRSIAAFQNRLFYLSAQSREGFYSREILDGEAPAFNEALGFSVPEEGGDPVAIREFGDRLIIFNETAIYALEGQALDDTGAGPGFAWPYQISNTVGARNPRTIVECNGQLLFESQDQIWRLTRGMELQPAGESVRLWKGSGALVGAHAVPGKHVAVFTRSDERAIVYDWLRDRWAVWTDHASASSAAVGGELYRVNSSGQVYRENASGTRAAMVIETGWVGAQVLGFQRVWELLLLGQVHTSATGNLTVKLGYNGDPYWVDTFTFNLATLSAFDYSDYLGAGLSSSYKDETPILKLHPSRQKCTSLRVRIETAGGQDISIAAIGFLIGVRSGMHRVNAARVM